MTSGVIFHGGPAELLSAAGALLTRREAENSLLLGIAGDLMHMSAPPADGALFGTVASGDGAAAAFLFSPPRPLVLAGDEPPALGQVAAALSRQGGRPSACVGPGASASRFGEAWSRRSGAEAALSFHMIAYQTERAIRPPAAGGAARPAARGELDLVAAWAERFSEEAGVLAPEREVLRSRLERGWIHVWARGGEPISMAGCAGPTPRGIRLNLVYTPPAFRGRGYAANVVWALTAKLLAEGRRYCFLFADAANDRANRLYRGIGYTAAGTLDEVRFRYP